MTDYSCSLLHNEVGCRQAWLPQLTGPGAFYISSKWSSFGFMDTGTDVMSTFKGTVLTLEAKDLGTENSEVPGTLTIGAQLSGRQLLLFLGFPPYAEKHRMMRSRAGTSEAQNPRKQCLFTQVS